MYPSLFSRDLFSEMDAAAARCVARRSMRRRPSIRGFAQGFPALNVGSTPNSVEIYAFAPGLDPSKIEVDLDRRVLTLAGERAPDIASADDEDDAAHQRALRRPLPPRHQPARGHRSGHRHRPTIATACCTSA